MFSDLVGRRKIFSPSPIRSMLFLMSHRPIATIRPTGYFSVMTEHYNNEIIQLKALAPEALLCGRNDGIITWTYTSTVVGISGH